jgi:predicted amidohydrolase YtcJ
MQALNMGWLVQNASHFEHGRFLDKYGSQESLRIPPIATAMKLGIAIGAGTDAHRVMSYNPFVSLQWLVDGKTVDGQNTRAATELLSRMDALKLYTQGSAWFARADKDRGNLQVGMLADLAVLDKDFLTIPTHDISSIRSHLTMVGGEVVYTSGALGR